MPPTKPTTAWRYANSLLKGGLDDLIVAGRAAEKSWYEIALEIHTKTKGEVTVTPETVRRWLPAEDAA